MQSNWYITCGDMGTLLWDGQYQADLVFCDPPYNLGIDYGPKCPDKWTHEKFAAMLHDWVYAATATVSKRGSLWFLVPDEWAAETCMTMKSTGLHMRGWIKWYETFGVNCTRKFNRTSRHLLYFVQDEKKCIFNQKEVRVQSARQRLGDKRACQDGKVLDDVWQIPRLVGNAKERIKGAPTQLPVALLDRIVRAVTLPDSLVLDPFVGTGTTGEAALKLGRNFWGIDLEERWCKVSRDRLKTLGTEMQGGPNEWH